MTLGVSCTRSAAWSAPPSAPPGPAGPPSPPRPAAAQFAVQYSIERGAAEHLVLQACPGHGEVDEGELGLQLRLVVRVGQLGVQVQLGNTVQWSISECFF